MKKIFFLSMALLLAAVSIYSKTDISKKPEPLPEKEFVFPKYEQFKLANGLNVFVIEDNEQPTFAVRMLIAGGSSVEGQKSGIADITSTLLTKGAGRRNALEIAQALDGVGASISASASSDYITIFANSLEKHSKLLMEILKDVVLNPTFPEDEFDKLIPQYKSEIKNDKGNPNKLASNLARKVLYGENHPYALQMTDKTLDEIKVDDIKNFYKSNFKPNNSTIAVIGSIKASEVRTMMEQAFGEWQKGSTAGIKLPTPQAMPLGVYFVKRPASVQSTIQINTLALPYNDPDYETLDIAASVIGSGFAGRLFRTLRETYSYTYTPYGTLTAAKYFNRFVCGADVRNSVTDSAISVTLEQLKLLTSETPADEELNRIKRLETGNYLMNFESTEFIAGLIQNADFQGEELEKLKTYPQRIMAMTPFEIRKVANKYMNPRNAYIVVVGSPDVEEKLNKFGKVYAYDLDLKPLTGSEGKLEKVSLNPKELIENYTDAIGGKKAIDRVNSIILEGKVELQAQGGTQQGSLIQKTKAGRKQYQDMKFSFINPKMWVNDTMAWIGMQGNIQKAEDKNLEKSLFEAELFCYTKLLDNGWQCEVLGKQGDNILMKALTPFGREITIYYNAKNFLIEKVEEIESTPQGPVPITDTYKKYEKYGDIMLPKVWQSENPMYSIIIDATYKINENIDDSEFMPAK